LESSDNVAGSRDGHVFALRAQTRLRAGLGGSAGFRLPAGRTPIVQAFHFSTAGDSVPLAG
jgi:hypothetical protein